MREFVYYSAKAVTAGNLIKDDLKKAGRLDIVCNFIVSCFFISNAMREDVKLHLIFDGGPNNPRHLVLESNEDMPISKKNVAGLIRRMLYKARDEEGLREIVPGCGIERKGLVELLKELNRPLRCETAGAVRPKKSKISSVRPAVACETDLGNRKKVLGCEIEGKNVFVLDKRGVDIRKLDLKGNEVFVVGDHEGFPSGFKKFLKRVDKVSVGPRVLFASQVAVILHNEIDRQHL